MAHIVYNGRRIKVGAWGIQRPTRGGKRCHRRCEIDVYGRIKIAAYQKRLINRLAQDTALIQAHFGGISRSEAAQRAIALTADAIRQDKALPDV
jgi:hypothetical protein